MPNWCDNNLSITGTEESLRQLEREIKEVGGICDAIMPTPPELNAVSGGRIHYDADGNWASQSVAQHKESNSSRQVTDEDKEMFMKKYGAKDWYDWNVKFRGSKWGVTMDTIFAPDEEKDWVEEGDDGVFGIHLYYQSAWAPNTEVSQAILEREGIQKIYHDYMERGMGFCGEAIGEKYEGEIIWNEDCRDEITFADLMEHGEDDGYEEVEVKDLLVYLDDKPFGAFISKDEKWMEVLPFGLQEIICLNVAPDTGKGMISEYEQEEYIR